MENGNGTSRESLLAKVRALMSKTVENGCSEAEAMAALTKADAMISAYEISEEELQLTKEEKAILGGCGVKDPHNAKEYLCWQIAKFTQTKAWIHREHGAYSNKRTREVRYCGLKADVEFAQWLTESLAGFVVQELVEYLIAHGPRESRRHTNSLSRGFVQGCCNRINQRLSTLVLERRRAAERRPEGSTSTALVVIQGKAIEDYMHEHGIRLGSSSQRRMAGASSAYQAGHAAGDRASFGRPVGVSSLRITH